jgi:DNA recombination protein RmuC
MAGTTLAVAIILGAGIAGLLGWLLGAARARAERAAAEELRRQLATVEGRAPHRRGRARRGPAGAGRRRDPGGGLRTRLAEQQALLESAESRLSHTFRALAAEALQANNRGFWPGRREDGGRAPGERGALEARQRIIEGMVKPVKESLDKVDGKIQELERERGQAYGR